jgi:hypothetical protein
MSVSDAIFQESFAAQPFSLDYSFHLDIAMMLSLLLSLLY